MQKYLLTILLKADLKDDDRKTILDLVTKKLEKVGKEDFWGVRSLSYPIKKQDRAYYAHFEFESEPSSIPSLDKSLKLNEDILRYLLVKSDTKIRKNSKSKVSKEDKKEDEKSEDKVEVKEAAQVAA